ncbi:MAG TPA: zinc dependent phospholipase C family protein [Terriglobales bacterium]|nr:zinc dependent phospholipase C family protein [Terriglobales bacterium]
MAGTSFRRHTRRPLAACLALLLAMTAFSVPSSAYSVLTHEQIVDLVWADEIVPLLLQRYPDASPDQLRAAHAFAYGGCLIQDIGYYPFGSRFFSDLVHYVRSGDFVASLITEAGDVNEYAFALGALAHYAADISGHPAVNAAVAQEFPKLRAKYGKAITFAEDPRSHIRTEFGFDVVQVAKNRYTSEGYHDFIGFQVSKPLLERAFRDTYGLELRNTFGDFDLSVGTFRRSVSTVVPEMTRVALLLKKDELVKENPTFAKKKFLYNLKRADFEREWGKSYKKPGIGARIFAALFRMMPKVGPFKALKFQMPSPDTETLYLASVNGSVQQYRIYLHDLAAQRLVLANTDFDTGKLTRAGEYRLSDDAYAKLLNKLAEAKFADMPDPLRQNILEYYSHADATTSSDRNRESWTRTLENIRQLKLVAAKTAALP